MSSKIRFFLQSSLKLFFNLIIVVNLISALAVAQSADVSEERKWREAVRLEPKKSINHFNLAVAYHKNGKLKKALRNYAKVIKMKSPLAPVCYYYMAKIFKQKKDLRRAKLAINKVNIKSVPATLRKRVLLFKNGLYVTILPEEPTDSPTADSPTEAANEQQETQAAQTGATPQEEKRFSAYYDLGIGTNDNPSYASSFSESDSQWTGKLYLGYKLFLGDAYEITSNYAYNSASYGDNSDSNTTYHSLSLPGSYYFGSSRIRITPDYAVDTFGGETYSYTASAALDYTLKVDTYIWTLYYQYQNMSVADDDNDYLNGNAGKYKTSVQKRWTSSDLTFGLTYSDYNYDDSDDVTSSYSGPLVDVTYGHYLGSWDFSLYANLEKRSYATDSDNFDREDYRKLTSLTAGWTYNKWMRLYFSATYSDNSSNDDDNEYHQASFIFGFSGGY